MAHSDTTETSTPETGEMPGHRGKHVLEIRFMSAGDWQPSEEFNGSLDGWKAAKAAWESRVETEGCKPIEERSQWRVRRLDSFTVLES